MMICGIRQTHIIRELPSLREPIVTPDLVHRVVKHGASGMSIYQIAAALGISKAVVTKIITALFS
jgi:hypothetical protein